MAAATIRERRILCMYVILYFMAVIVKLQGGLGNQLFQYVAGRQLALLRNTEFKIDATLYETYEYHAYSLAPFNVIENFATKEEVASVQKYKRRSGRWWYPYNKLIANPKRYFSEKRFDFDPDVFTLPDGVYLDGYWQTEKYFTSIEEIVRKELTLKVPLSLTSLELLEQMKATNSVSLHVRRGLYVSHPVFSAQHGSCSSDYYDPAIDHMSAQVKDPHFFIFSDDKEWAKENIRPNYPCTYIEHTTAATDYEDIILMSNCKHHILANSTFSWWGAWLNTSKEKIVIGPKEWFRGAKAKKYTTVDLLPPTWIRL
jgi:hypothetical protein